MGYRNHLDHKKTRRLIKETAQRMETFMSEAIDRITAALAGIAGDIQRLKDAAAALQQAVDEAIADKDAAVAAAVAQAQADFDAALAPVVARAEGLDAENVPDPEA